MSGCADLLHVNTIMHTQIKFTTAEDLSRGPEEMVLYLCAKKIATTKYAGLLVSRRARGYLDN